MRNNSNGEETKMNASYIKSAKGMAHFLLTREHRGPGDTIDAAAHRLQRKLGVPSALLMRLRHREVKDMLMSNFLALASAYQTVSDKMERAYEHEKNIAVDPRVLRLAHLVAGAETDEEAAP